MRILPNSLKVCVSVECDHLAPSQWEKLWSLSLGAIVIKPSHLNLQNPLRPRQLSEELSSAPKIFIKEDVLASKRLGAEGVIFGPGTSVRTLERAREILGTEKWIGAEISETDFQTDENSESVDFWLHKGMHSSNANAGTAPQSFSAQVPTVLHFSASKPLTQEIQKSFARVSGICISIEGEDSMADLEKWVTEFKSRMGHKCNETNLGTTNGLGQAFRFSELSVSTLRAATTPVLN
jgi:hypothetical protein